MGTRCVKVIRAVVWAAVVAVLGVPSAPALADTVPPLNAAAEYAINVPSSVLSSVAPAGSSAAALANAQQFDWAFADPSFAAVSGTSTSTPAPPDVALTPAEREAWATLTRDFAAPATRAATLTKVIGGSSVALMGFTVGTLLGSSTSRLFGFQDEQVCAQRNGALNFAASVLDNVDCSTFNNTLAQVQRDADQVPVSSFSPVTLNGVTVDYAYGVPWESPTWNLLTCFNYSGTIPQGYNVAVNVWGADGTANSTGSYTNNMYCGPITQSNLSGWWVKAPLLRFQVVLYDMYTNQPTLKSGVAEGTVTIPNPPRHWHCQIDTADGHSYSADSATFTEQDSSLAPIICPAIPAGSVAVRVRISEATDTQSVVVGDFNTTTEYQQWENNFSQCTNGSCALDLRKGGTSCFRMANVSDCNGWATDPNKDSTYACIYGTVAVSLSECDVYARVFDPAHWSDGTAYADPASGNPATAQTSATQTDKVTRALLARHWNVWGPTPTELELGNGDEGEAARTIAKQCVALGAAETCKTEPIFAPGNNVQEAALHDYNAITFTFDPGSNGAAAQPAELTWSATGAPSGWYYNTIPCVAGTYGAPDMECDEYPFNSTAEAGPGVAPPATAASIKPIPKADNSNEGLYLQHFYSDTGCGLKDPARNPTAKFLVIPTPSLTAQDGTVLSPGIPTSEWCTS